MCHGKAIIEFDCTEEEFEKQKDASSLPGEKWTFILRDKVEWSKK